jgi:hypothetical protein
MSGDRLEISIAIAPQVIKGRGKVMHAQWRESEKLQAGIRFDDLPELDRLYLREYLEYLAERED